MTELALIDDQAPTSAIAHYLAEIELYEREAGPWLRTAKRIVQRYKNERKEDDERRRFATLWANVQTLLPALYARDPKADFSRRFNVSDPVGRCAADVLEKCVGYHVAETGFGATMKGAVRDRLLGGRGTAWVRYVPHFRDLEAGQGGEIAAEGAGATNSGDAKEPLPLQEIEHEEVMPDWVHLEDFGHNVARSWDEVYLVWRRVFMDREKLKERFGTEQAERVPLDHKDERLSGSPVQATLAKATIYELWDRRTKRALWIHKELRDAALDTKDDPLKLSGFWPCPEPLFATVAGDSLVPTPDYKQYEDQALQLDFLVARIAMLTKALKVAGVYDASAEGLDRLLSEGVENRLIPVDAWAAFAEKGGLQGVVSFLPIAEVASVLAQLYEAREHVKQDIFEITGLSDILRGASDPDETATAQGIKAGFGTMRLDAMQGDVRDFARALVRIMAEIIAGHFTLATIKEISGKRLFDTAAQKQMAQTGQLPQPPDMRPDEWDAMLAEPTWEEVFALLRDRPGRRFRLDIETRSTIKQDEQQEKADRVEFITAVSGFIEKALAAGQQHPELSPLLGQLLMFAVRAFPVGKELDAEFSAALAKLEKAAANPQQKPDPAMAKVEADKQAAAAKLQGEMQLAQAKLQADLAIQSAKLQNEKELAQTRLQIETQSAQTQQMWQQWQEEQENRADLQRAQAEAQIKAGLEQMKAELDAQIQLAKAHIQAASAIEVARISASQDDGAEAYEAERQGENA